MQSYISIDFLLPPAICVFYRPDLYVPKWVLFGQKIGLNLRIVVICYKIATCILAVGYLLELA